MTEEKRFSLPESTLNAVLGYLGECPFKDVAKLVQMVQQAKLVEDQKDAPVVPKREAAE